MVSENGPYYLDPFDTSIMGLCDQYEGDYYDKLQFMCKIQLPTGSKIPMFFQVILAISILCTLCTCVTLCYNRCRGNEDFESDGNRQGGHIVHNRRNFGNMRAE
jgi:hypothetical protein